MVEEAIEDGTGRGHVAQEFAPVLDGAVAGHDGGTVFVTAHEHFQEVREFLASFWPKKCKELALIGDGLPDGEKVGLITEKDSCWPAIRPRNEGMATHLCSQLRQDVV